MSDASTWEHQMDPQAIDVPLSAEQIGLFNTYAQCLKAWNEKMNLTAITDDESISLRHFVDSLTLVAHIERERDGEKKGHLSLVDVGSGAGFPGIPLKIVVPYLNVTLLDARQKRISFLHTLCDKLGLADVQMLHLRAEEAGRIKMHREAYDIATARAVAPLPILCEYCLPLVKIGGVFLAMKGRAEEEVKAAQKAIITLGGTLDKAHVFCLPNTDVKRTILVIRKIRATPARYPRKAGKPEKEPIL